MNNLNTSKMLSKYKKDLSHIDRLIERAVRTGNFNGFGDLPFSLNGDDIEQDNKTIFEAIMHGDEEETLYYIRRFINGYKNVAGASFLLRDGALSFNGKTLTDEETIFKVANSYEWLCKDMHSNERFPITPRPVFTRKNRKHITAQLAKHHGLKFNIGDVVDMGDLCYPAVQQRSHKTAPYRGKGDAYKLPRKRNKRYSDMAVNNPQLVKAKILRAEIVNWIILLEAIQILESQYFLEQLATFPKGFLFGYVNLLTEEMMHCDKEERDLLPDLQDKLCSERDLYEAVFDHHARERLDSWYGYREAKTNPMIRLVQLLDKVDSTFYNGTLKAKYQEAVLNALALVYEPADTE